jgi:hypothetical protein
MELNEILKTSFSAPRSLLSVICRHHCDIVSSVSDSSDSDGAWSEYDKKEKFREGPENGPLKKI